MSQSNERMRVVILRVVVPVDAPSRIMVIPWGEVQGKAGDFVCDEAAGAAMLAAFRKHGADLPIDYEHATVGGEFASPDGTAPAAGWIKSIDVVPGVGLFANVEWTRRGAEFVAEKEYRYLSPVVWVRLADRRAVVLHSVALTNKPAIAGMTPIVNSEGNVPMDSKFDSARWFLNLEATATQETIMQELEKYLAQLRELAGVAATTDQAGVLAALKQRIAAPPPATPKLSPVICKALGVKEDATDAELEAAIHKAVTPPPPDPSKFVPVEDVRKLTDRINTVEGELIANKAAAFIEAGQKAGKITEASTEAWREIYLADPAKAEKHLAAMPVVAPPEGRLVAHKGGAGGPAGADRTVVIAKAAGQWDAEPNLQRLCCKAAAVDDELRVAGLPLLTAEERKNYPQR